MSPPLSRRRFLERAALAASGALAGAALPIRAAEPASAPAGLGAGLRFGADVDKLYDVKGRGAFAVLDHVRAHGLDGAFFRTMLDLSPTLDAGELREIKAHADSLGLFLDGGVGSVNPYNTAETPEIRRFGGGDYRRAVERMIDAARLVDCTELWAISGHTVHGRPFFVAYERFRTDVTWSEQLAAIRRFVALLSPKLRDTGCRLNLETHGDETSHDLLRLIDQVGADVLGVTLDTGNLPLVGDVPDDAVARLAPHVHLTHCKDGILVPHGAGVLQQLRPIGQGVVDWERALATLAAHQPNLHLSFEEYRAENPIPLGDPAWRAHFPDLTDADVAKLEALAGRCAARIARGEIAGLEAFRALPFTDADRIASYRAAADHLRAIARRLGHS